ncbi:hypothetical protein ACIBQ1_24145 [Nonomuraea sp. NPDC050153]|uniref:hypothetical protein n=1 Tax=Nonomuraea sp. NPDC050153 TaxID=3364359 RepID=UPI0037B34C0D
MSPFLQHLLARGARLLANATHSVEPLHVPDLVEPLEQDPLPEDEVGDVVWDAATSPVPELVGKASADGRGDTASGTASDTISGVARAAVDGESHDVLRGSPRGALDDGTRDPLAGGPRIAFGDRPRDVPRDVPRDMTGGVAGDAAGDGPGAPVRPSAPLRDAGFRSVEPIGPRRDGGDTDGPDGGDTARPARDSGRVPGDDLSAHWRALGDRLLASHPPTRFPALPTAALTGTRTRDARTAEPAQPPGENTPTPADAAPTPADAPTPTDAATPTDADIPPTPTDVATPAGPVDAAGSADLADATGTTIHPSRHSTEITHMPRGPWRRTNALASPAETVDSPDGSRPAAGITPGRHGTTDARYKAGQADARHEAGQTDVCHEAGQTDVRHDAGAGGRAGTSRARRIAEPAASTASTAHPGNATGDGSRGAELVIEHLEVQLVGVPDGLPHTEQAARTGRPAATGAGPSGAGQPEATGAWDPAARNYIGRW